MGKITNQFSWSFTRHKTFSECRRQYYHQYYGYWDGWSDNAPDQARLTYRLKNIVSLPMWVGDIVHRTIERIIADLRNRELNTLDHYQKMARGMMNREWAQSIEKKWQWKPKYNLNLFEHYYDQENGIEITPEQRVAARDKVFRCIANFMSSAIFEELGGLRTDGWKSVEKLDQFVVGEMPVFVKIDCATTGNGIAASPDGPALTIFDWKTGQETEETMAQLGCYALYGYQIWRVPVEKQRLISYYLDTNSAHEHVPTAEELIDTKDFIMNSMSGMTALLDSSAARNEASEEKFPKTDRQSSCRRCNFRELCFSGRKWNG